MTVDSQLSSTTTPDPVTSKCPILVLRNPQYRGGVAFKVGFSNSNPADMKRNIGIFAALDLFEARAISDALNDFERSYPEFPDNCITITP